MRAMGWVLVLRVGALGPVVLVPGLMSSQIETKVNGSYVPPHLVGDECDAHGGAWWRSWLAFNEFVGDNVYCFLHRMATPWGPDGVAHNRVGVDTRISGWGDADSVSTVDPMAWRTVRKAVTVFGPLVDTLADKEAIHGAPYDWRFAPDRADMVAHLQALVEQASARGPVLLVSHSMGGLYTLALLRAMTPAWQQEHVRGWAAISAPLGGALPSLGALVSGDDNVLQKIASIAFASRTTVVDTVRTFGSLYSLLPDPAVFKDRVLAQAGGDTYTAADVPRLLERAGVDPAQLAHRPQVRHLGKIHTAVHCFISSGVQGTRQYQWNVPSHPNATWPAPTVLYDELGDGTVAGESLEACLELNPASVHRYQGVAHQQMLWHPEVMAHIKELAQPGTAVVV